jgi:glycerol uptake facilitator-like aquaporin
MFNPAAAISQVVAGNLGPGQFFNVVAGEMVGAFLGGLTIFFLYMPQLYRAGEKVRGRDWFSRSRRGRLQASYAWKLLCVGVWRVGRLSHT